MTTLFKLGKSWVLRYQVGKRHTTRSLGAISESCAKQLYDEHCAQRHVQSTTIQSPLVLTHREMYGLYRKSMERAKARDIAFALGFDDVQEMFRRAHGHCELTGIAFDRVKPEGCTKRPWWPSIDRANSRGGYTAANCRLVCVAVNIAMGEWGFNVLRRMSRALMLGPAAQNSYALITPN